MLGFAANCKNEGVALLGAVVLALVVVRGAGGGIVSRITRLWPAYLLAAPWMLIRAAHALPTDLVSGDALTRIIDRLGQAGPILRLLSRGSSSPGDGRHSPWGFLSCRPRPSCASDSCSRSRPSSSHSSWGLISRRPMTSRGTSLRRGRGSPSSWQSRSHSWSC